MRLLALPLTILATAVLAACASPLEPAGAPHATVTDSHVAVDADRTDTFRVLEVDGHRVLDLSDQPVKKIGHDFTNAVVAGRPVRVEIEGLAAYYSTMHRLAWDPMHVQGVVEFVPAAGARYVLHGTITPELSTVWVEDEASHAMVGAKVSAARSAAPAADGSSAPQRFWQPAQPVMRGGGA